MNYFPLGITLNEHQQSIIDGDSNVVINGAAGTGKTIAAIHLARKLSKDNSVCIVVYTRALEEFINQALTEEILSGNLKICTSFRLGDEKFDYIIVDEAQDFSLKQIREAIKESSKGIYFFGDNNQRIYKYNPSKSTDESDKTVQIEDIVNETNFPLITLSENMRVSAPIAELIKTILPEFSIGSASHNKCDIKPYFSISLDEEDSEILAILTAVLENSNTAILFWENKRVKKMYEYLLAKNIITNLGFKSHDENHLILNKSNSVNILTYHSAKGLEFDNIIMPNGGILQSIEQDRMSKKEFRKLMYVACSRARKNIIFTTDYLFSGYGFNEEFKRLPPKSYYGVFQEIGDSTKDELNELKSWCAHNEKYEK